MLYMFKALSTDDIPDECGVAIEYRIPATSKRVDFIRHMKKIISQRCGVYFASDEEGCLPHSGLLGKHADEV